MQLFYNSELNETTKTFNFSKDESRHIVKVLRKSEGDILYITNGNGQLFTAEIILANDKKCNVTILETIQKRNVGIIIYTSQLHLPKIMIA